MKELNIFGQYVGRHLEGNLDFILPDTRQLSGRYCHLQPLATYHCDDLYQGWHSIEDPRDWTYLPDERPETRQATFDYIKRIISQGGISYYAIIENKSAKARGTLALFKFDAQDVTWTGQGDKPAVWRSSDISSRAFCSHCGSSVGAIDDAPTVALLTGVFDEPQDEDLHAH